MTTPTKSFLLVHVFGNIANLEVNRSRFSTPVEYFNASWEIKLRRAEDHMVIVLLCDRPSDVGTWSIKTKHQLKIVSVNGKCNSHSEENTYTQEDRPVVYNINMTFEELKKSYVVDDKLILEAHVVIEEMTGIERPKKLISFDETTEEMSNIVLKVGDEKFYVLKEFLVLQSAFFKDLFFEKPNETETSEVSLEDVDPHAFQTFLEVLYLEPSLTDGNIEDVLQLTDKFKSKNGARLCEMFLICDSKHCLRTKLRLASLYKFEKLKKSCFDSMKSAADVRAVIGPDDSSEVDLYIAGGLVKKLLSFSV